ncbi:MAG: hypothetical protein R3C01_02525 [Planctomycetaceae bacterium]
MSNTPLPIDPDDRRPWWIYVSGGAGLLVLLAIIFSFKASDPPIDPKKKEGTVVRSEQEVCLQDFEEILAAIEPDRLGETSSRDRQLGSLRRWIRTCLPNLERQIGFPLTTDEELVRKLAKGDLLANIEQKELMLRDVAHIRNCSMARHIASSLTKNVDDPVLQMVILFTFVNRNVLPPRDSSNIATTPYQTLLIGRGDARQRAWLFSELLRQLSLDAYVVEVNGLARDAAEAESADGAASSPRIPQPFLIGVGVRRGDSTEVYLFDMEHQIPIPAASEGESKAASVLRPATLSEVLQDDGLFRQLDLPEVAYPLTADLMKDLSVKLIGTGSLWATRMATIDAVDARSVIFFDGLGNSKLRTPGLYDRAVAAGAGGRWSADDVSIWDYPELQTTEYEEVAPAIEGGEYQGRSRAELDRAVSYFSDVLHQPQEELPGSTPGRVVMSQPLIRARNLQLMGRPGDAMTAYGVVRTVCGGNYEKYSGCIESAAYWIELARMEREPYPPRQETMRRSIELLASELAAMETTRAAYRKDLWTEGLLSLAAQLAAELGVYGEAVTITARLQPNFGRGYLVRRWIKVGNLSATTPTGPAAPSPGPSGPGVGPLRPGVTPMVEESPSPGTTEQPPATTGGEGT